MSEMEPIHGVEPIVEQTRLSKPEATVAYDAALRREDTAGKQQMAVVLAEWATHDKYEISDQPVVVCEKLEAITDDCYFVEGAAEVDITEQNADWLTDVVQVVDDTGGDYVDERGERYLPQSSVNSMFVVLASVSPDTVSSDKLP